MLEFEGVMEMELSDFVVVVVLNDPQPAIDIKARGRAKEQVSLTRQRNAFMLASRRLLKYLSNA